MRILLAEDDRSLARGLSVLLTRNGYTVDCVHDGHAALNYAEEYEYDCLILDVMMPGMDGVSVLAQLRARQCAAPVMLLTAKNELSDRINGLDAGADDYVTKPFVSEELLARLRALTRRRGEYTHTQLTFADLTLDRASLSLSCAGKRIRLNNKSFQVMEMFMRNPRIVISADRLMESIWGWESEAEIHVVWVNVSQLRKQLPMLGSRCAIRTVRGVGYVLEDQGESP